MIFTTKILTMSWIGYLHLADAFIQSDLQYVQAMHFLSVCVLPGN